MSTEPITLSNRFEAAKESLFARRESSVMVALVAMFVLGIIVNSSNFLTLNNLIRVLRGAAVVGIIGYSISLLMVTAEFDLSVGSLLGITAGLGAVMIGSGYDVVFTIAITLVLATLYGITQGFLVTKFGLPSLIVTIGTLTLLRGAHFLLLGGSAVTISLSQLRESGEQAGWLLQLIGGTYSLPLPVTIPGTGVELFSIPAITYAVPGIHSEAQTFQSFPAQIIWLLAGLLVFHHILFRTTFGQHVRATGDNIESVNTTGIDSDRIKIACFAIVGLTTAFAGISQLAYIGSVSPGTGSGTELIAIAAVVLGGTKLTGGDGSMTGVLMGALVLGLAQNVLTLGGFGPKFSRLITGLFIILAIGLDTIFKEFDVALFSEWYTNPLSSITGGVGEFFSGEATDRSADEGLAFLFSSVLATTALVLVGMLLPAILGAVGVGGLGRLADNFSIYIAELNIEGVVMIMLQLYLVVLLYAVLALVTIQGIGSRLHGTLGVDESVLTVTYGMAPMPLLAVPLLLLGFNFLNVLVVATVAIVVLVVVYAMYQGLVNLQGLEQRNALITIAGTLVAWLLVGVYFIQNLA